MALTFQTNPGGLRLVVNGTSGDGAFTRTVIIGSTNTISAPSPQTKGKQTYTLQLLVGRGRPDPQHHRPGHRHHLHRPVPPR